MHIDHEAWARAAAIPLAVWLRKSDRQQLELLGLTDRRIPQIRCMGGAARTAIARAERANALLALLADDPTLTLRALAATLDAPQRSIEHLIDDLVRAGRLVVEQRGAGRVRRVQL